MKRVLCVLLLACCVFSINGCNGPDAAQVEQIIKKNKDQILKGINLASSQGVRYGMKKWAEKNPTAVTETATTLRRNLNEQLIPYFIGGQELPSTAEIREFINSSLFKDVPAEVKMALVAASAMLDAYLPVPSSTTYLNVDQVDYIKAFLTGVSSGLDGFTPNPDGTFSDSRHSNAWITG